MIRELINDVFESRNNTTTVGKLYDYFMFILIIVSIIPLMFIEEYAIFTYIEIIATIIFLIDYIMRWVTADYRLKKGVLSFIIYPFTGWAIVDLLSILPGINLLGPAFRMFRVTRLLRIMRVFKIFRYSNSINLFLDILYKERKILMTLLLIAIVYIFVTAIILFNVEPHINPVTGKENFIDFFDALYWATVTLTTVGYGDLCPVTTLGRLVSMCSALFGVAIIALPSGVITASYLNELKKRDKVQNEEKN